MNQRTDFTNATHEEIAAAVSEALRKQGITAVMSGGGCVSVYSENRYQSDDLDFIDSYRDKIGIQKALAAINFYSDKDRYFKNSTTTIYLEFPPGPVMIGNEFAKEPVDWETPAGKILMLNPTDCVKDRLAKFYAWNDAQALYQALLVVAAQPVNFREIERWSIKSEGQANRYKFFRSLAGKVQSRWAFAEKDIVELATDLMVQERIKKLGRS
jgi:hypothetical protein